MNDTNPTPATGVPTTDAPVVPAAGAPAGNTTPVTVDPNAPVSTNAVPPAEVEVKLPETGTTPAPTPDQPVVPTQGV